MIVFNIKFKFNSYLLVKFNHYSYKLAKVFEYLQMSVYIPVNVFVECAALNDIYLSGYTDPSTCITRKLLFLIFPAQACKMKRM